MTTTSLDAFRALTKLKLGAATQTAVIGFMAQLDYDDWREINQTGIAATFGIDRSRLSFAIKAVAEEGLVLRSGEDNTSQIYRLARDYDWQASMKRYTEALNKRAQAAAKTPAKKAGNAAAKQQAA